MASKVLYQKNVHHKSPKTKTKFAYGANEDGTATGTGGRDRRNKIDEAVDATHTGTKKRRKR